MENDMLISYSQRDPKWSQQKLGASSLTVGRYGCTTCCIADLSTYFGDNLDPLQTCKKIQYTKPSGKESGGLVIWGSCTFGTFKFERRQYGRNERDIMAALKDPDRAVILEVNKGAHWVTATGYDGVNKIFKIADPWFGDRSTMKRYGDSITGAAYFRRV